MLDSLGRVQIFTQAPPDTGGIHEIIQRKGAQSFSTGNMRRLMASTRDLNQEKTTRKPKRK